MYAEFIQVYAIGLSSIESNKDQFQCSRENVKI